MGHDFVAELYRAFRGALMDVQPDDTVLGVRRVLLVPGAAGVLMGIVWRRQWKLIEATVAAAAGVCCVFWIAPALVEWLGVRFEEKPAMVGLIFWACGMTGMYIVDFISKTAVDPWGSYKRWRERDK